MGFVRKLQVFFSLLLFLAGCVLIVFEFINLFTSPIATLAENPGLTKWVYLFRLIAASVIAATGVFGMLSGRRFLHLMFACASLSIGVFLYFAVEWYLCVPVIGLCAITILLNIGLASRGQKKEKKRKKEED